MLCRSPVPVRPQLVPRSMLKPAESIEPFVEHSLAPFSERIVAPTASDEPATPATS